MLQDAPGGLFVVLDEAPPTGQPPPNGACAPRGRAARPRHVGDKGHAHEGVLRCYTAPELGL